MTPQLRIAHPVKLGQSCIPAVVVQPQLAVNHKGGQDDACGISTHGGVLVAVCLNGPRQQEKLLPFSDVREELPRGTFAYTDVPTMIIRLRA